MKKLAQHLKRLDKKAYGYYNKIRGEHDYADFKMSVDHVQGDPYARPSLVSVAIPFKNTRFPMEWCTDPVNQIPLGDFINRLLWKEFSQLQYSHKGSGNSGRFHIAKPGQQILPRSSIYFSSENLIVRFRVGLPADGRKILAEMAMELFIHHIPLCVNSACFLQNDFEEELRAHILLYNQQEELRQQVFKQGLIGFVPNGAVLPREAGASDKPLAFEEAVSFRSPAEMEQSFELSNGKKIVGMGIKKGVNLIVGGGFHGKSTLIEALEKGIYNHIKDDGREFICVPEETMKIRSENGRLVNNVNIEPFINNLPGGKGTKDFKTLNASGSTSQAASIVESVNSGAKVLLMDEDTCATNFMIRDQKMRKLIADENEPITPLIQKIRTMSQGLPVSFILVLGGCGEYFSVADKVIGLKNYELEDLTESARKISPLAGESKNLNNQIRNEFMDPRRLIKNEIYSSSDRLKVKFNKRNSISLGDFTVPIQQLEQLVCEEQVATLAYLMLEIVREYENKEVDLEALKRYTNEQRLNRFGKIKGQNDGMAWVRYLDLISVINRMPGIEIKKAALK